MKHPTCPKCKGRLKYEPADILGPERVECILCGWWKTRDTTIKIEEETTMATKNTHGTCNHCQRKNVLLPSPGKCSRCYSRMARGADIFTGYPLPQKSTAAPVAPAILADSEPTAPVSGLPPKDGRSEQVPLRAHDYNIKRISKRPPSDIIPAEIGFITSPGVTTGELFSDEEDLDLLTRLLAIARGNRRSLQGEILYRLDKSLEAA